MDIALCPHCGIDFDKRADTVVGDLSISLYGDTRWRGERIKLTEAEASIVLALARAAGRHILPEALLNIIGSRSEDLNTVRVLIHRARAKFFAADPSFDRIESRHVQKNSGYRWLVN